MMLFLKLQLIYFLFLVIIIISCALLLLIGSYGFLIKINGLAKFKSCLEESRNAFSFLVFYCLILIIAFAFHVNFFVTNFFLKKKKKQSYFFTLFDLIFNFFYCFFYLIGECICKTFFNFNWVVGFLYIYVTKMIIMLRYVCFTLIFYPFINNSLDWYQIVRFEWFVEVVTDLLALYDPSLPNYLWYLWKVRGLSALAWVTVLSPVILSIFFIIGGTVQCFEFELMPESLFESYQSEAELLRLISQYSSTISSVCEIQIRALNCQFYLVKFHNNIFYQLYLTENFQDLILKDYQNLIEANKRYLLEPVSNQNNFSKILALTCFFTVCILTSFAHHYNYFMLELAAWDALGVAYEASLKK